MKDHHKMTPEQKDEYIENLKRMIHTLQSEIAKMTAMIDEHFQAVKNPTICGIDAKKR
jgi:hypothetical protein